MTHRRLFAGQLPHAMAMVAVLMLIRPVTGVTAALAKEETAAAREGFTEIDGEIQAVKEEILEINREILALEEQLLYPPAEQLLVFVSVSGDRRVGIGDITLQLDGKPLGRHLYTAGEAAAMQQGGIHRLYTGRLQQGEHVMDVFLSGTGADGRPFVQRQSARIAKGSGRRVVEIGVAARDEGAVPELTIQAW